MKKAERIETEKLVGRAFRCPDGLVRWITGLSTRGYYHLLWLHEESGVWYSGGIRRASKWYGGVEVKAPQAGDEYKLCDPMGRVIDRKVEKPQ